MIAAAAMRTFPKEIATICIFGVLCRIDVETAGPESMIRPYSHLFSAEFRLT